MSHTYERKLGTMTISIIVNSDWSGNADIVVESHDIGRIDRASCPAGELAAGDLHTVIRGQLNTVQWMAASALAAHQRAIGENADPTDRWCALTDSQRLELMGMCCRGCGSLDTGCRCWNDE